jgi:hypothetical protein
MGVAVVFAARITPEVFLGETELAALQSVDPSRLRHLALDRLMGRLILLGPGQPIIVLYDELEELIIATCFRALPQLASGEPVEVWFTDAPAEFRLEPVGSVVRVTGTLIPTFEAPSDDLLPALYACGTRFLSFLHATLAEVPEFQARLPDLEYWAERAAEALHPS